MLMLLLAPWLTTLASANFEDYNRTRREALSIFNRCYYGFLRLARAEVPLRWQSARNFTSSTPDTIFRARRLDNSEIAAMGARLTSNEARALVRFLGDTENTIFFDAELSHFLALRFSGRIPHSSQAFMATDIWRNFELARNLLRSFDQHHGTELWLEGAYANLLIIPRHARELEIINLNLISSVIEQSIASPNPAQIARLFNNLLATPSAAMLVNLEHNLLPTVQKVLRSLSRASPQPTPEQVSLFLGALIAELQQRIARVGFVEAGIWQARLNLLYQEAITYFQAHGSPLQVRALENIFQRSANPTNQQILDLVRLNADNREARRRLGFFIDYELPQTRVRFGDNEFLIERSARTISGREQETLVVSFIFQTNPLAIHQFIETHLSRLANAGNSPAILLRLEAEQELPEIITRSGLYEELKPSPRGQVLYFRRPSP